MARNWSTVDTVVRPNNRLAGQTRFSANLGIDYKPSDTWSTGASYSFSTGDDFYATQTSYKHSTPNRRLDTYALWKLSSEANIRLALRNLLAQPSQFIDQTSERFSDREMLYVATTTYPAYREVGISLEMKW